ncbi:MAG: HAD-IIA family hydrolase [Deltaproteobacteria bacterium]|nr:HAD-IIA family hydrolase [Deltaproteobacteria bacterium]
MTASAPGQIADCRGLVFEGKRIRAVVFDLDGTIYEGDKPADGALDLVRFFRENDVKVFYCTNNSTKTRRELRGKLVKMGLAASTDAIYSAAHAAGKYAAEMSIKQAYCFGADGLRQELGSSGVEVIEDASKAAVAILGLDPDVDYRKISDLACFRDREVTLVACNKDRFFPVEDGRLMPGCGLFVTMIEDLLKREVDHVVGKPNTYMLELLSKEHGLSSGEMLVAGDSYDSDMEMAKRFGCPSVLIGREKGSSIPGVAVVRNIAGVRDLFC